MSADPTEPTAEPHPQPRGGQLPAGTGPAPVPPGGARADSATEEVELWWGSYSGWTMVPSFAVCLVLTGLIAWAAWQLMPQHLWRATTVGAAGVVWAVQLLRFGARVFGCNYRLTTRRLLLAHGVRRMQVAVVELARVRRVTVDRRGLEAAVGVGRVLVQVEGEARPRALEGVRNPQSTADLIRAAVKTARGDQE